MYLSLSILQIDLHILHGLMSQRLHPTMCLKAKALILQQNFIMPK